MRVRPSVLCVSALLAACSSADRPDAGDDAATRDAADIVAPLDATLPVDATLPTDATSPADAPAASDTTTPPTDTPRADVAPVDAAPPFDVIDPRDGALDPIEPVWIPARNQVRVKAPAQQMHFTAGLPFRILADTDDSSAWMCPPGHPPYICPDAAVDFLVDGASVGVLRPMDGVENASSTHMELRLPAGLPLGDHRITLRYSPHMASAVTSAVAVTVHMDPMPTHARTVTLSADLMLSGATPLDWTDVTVIGNGHRVRAAAGYTGSVTIRDAFVTGLAAFDNQVGVQVTTTGAVDIERSVFEATAPLAFVVNGGSPVTIVGNEFRANNFVTYVASDPSRSPILDLSGSTTGAKSFRGNNVGAGIVYIHGMAGWQIGGLDDGQSNVFIGTRCVLDLEDAPDAVIQGNYLHHDYYGGFSQGFNLQYGGSSDRGLAEHNVIRDASWPVQSFGGEFRYNLVVNSGHDFVRSLQPGARLHHNLFVHAQSTNSGYNGAVLLYSGETGVSFYNNTIDGGGMTGGFDAPVLALGAPSVSVSSMRNNAVTQLSDVPGASGGAWVAGAGHVLAADYNAWFNPLATSTQRYGAGVVAGASPGAHDVQADPMFAGPLPEVPYAIDEGLVWLRRYGVSQVLAHYRALYTPRAGSPLIDAGDPGDGAGTDIGAIGAGTASVADQFGRVLRSAP